MVKEKVEQLDPNLHLADRLTKVIVVLMAVGTVFVFSARASLSRQWAFDNMLTHPGLHQLIFLPMAITVMLVVSKFDHQYLSFRRGIWRSFTPYLIAISVLLLILVLFIGPERNNARRWLDIPLGPLSFSFQPSELAKWSMIFFSAAICTHPSFQLDSFFKHFLPICGLIGSVVILILVQDFGTAAFVSLLSFILLMVGGAKWHHLLSPVPLAAAGFYLALFQYPHRMKRLMAFREPEKWADSVMYQPYQSLIAIGSGGVMGKGLGGGISKYGHLPEDHTDFIFAVVGEELGLIGTLGVILLFAFFAYSGLQVIARARDDFSRLLATGIVFAISIQAALNIGVVTVVLPTKGIPLPFISHGGSSLLTTAMAAGVLLNIAHQTEKPLTS